MLSGAEIFNFFLFLTTLIKEYGLKAFCHVSNMADNTRNKSTTFSCLDIGTRLLFRVFLIFKLWITESPKIFI